MVTTRSSQQAPGEHALLDALLSANTSRAKLLLRSDEAQQLARASGPSAFTCCHSAALVDAHRLVAPLVAAGLSPNCAIEPMDGQQASVLRQFLREHSGGKLPSSKLCSVFRGVTPLHIATWLGHQATVLALLESGADPNTACLEGRTALSIACYFLEVRPKKSLAIIQALLAAGADPLCSDFHGIGSLVLSPHCPEEILGMLLDRVLLRYGGCSTAKGGTDAQLGDGTAAAAGAAGLGDGAAGGASTSGGTGSGASASADGAGPSTSTSGGSGSASVQVDAVEGALAGPAEAVEGPGDVEMEPPLPALLPDKHADILQAALICKHWRSFDFFLAAASPETEFPPHAVSRILSLAIASGNTPLVLRVLHSGLRPDPAGNNSQGHPHVAVAAVNGHEQVLDALLAHGGAVTLKALHHATDTRSLRGLLLLLARGRPPVLSGDGPVHIGGAHSRNGELCVMLRLLRDTAFRLRYCYKSDLPRHAADSLRMVEALAAAGYRPTRYPQAIVHNGWIDMQGRLVSDYDPTVDRPAAFDLHGVNRFTWLAAKQEPWTCETHKQWPPRFRRAVQALLMAHHAGRVAAPAGAIETASELPASAGGEAAGGSSAGGGGVQADGPGKRPAKRARVGTRQSSRQQRLREQAAGAAGEAEAGRPAGAGSSGGRAVVLLRSPLSTLPSELVHNIIRLAAYPISSWAL